MAALIKWRLAAIGISALGVIGIAASKMAALGVVHRPQAWRSRSARGVGGGGGVGSSA